MTIVPEAINAAAGVLAVHRWKTMGTASVECECGAIVHGKSVAVGPSFDPDGPGYESAVFPADEAFRQHLAQAALCEAVPLIAAAERDRLRLSPDLRGATFLARDGAGREIAAVPWSVVADLLRGDQP